MLQATIKLTTISDEGESAAQSWARESKQVNDKTLMVRSLVGFNELQSIHDDEAVGAGIADGDDCFDTTF